MSNNTRMKKIDVKDRKIWYLHHIMPLSVYLIYLFFIYLLSPWCPQPYGFLHSYWAPTLTST
jgi:polyferredoxin